MKMTFCVVSLFAVLSAGSVWADVQPGMPAPGAPAPTGAMPAPGATNGVIVDQGGSLHYQAQPSMENGQQPPQQPPQQPSQQPSQQQPMTPNTPGMSATQPTPSMH